MSERPVLWRPSADRVARAELTAYAAWLREERGIELDAGYEPLRRWSVDEPEAFWASIWDRYAPGFEGSAPGGVVLASAAMPGARWFTGARVNYAERVFRDKPDGQVALRHAGEVRGAAATWTWGQLRERTARIRAGLVALGVGRGDRVAAYLPNVPETIAACLATASLGAIWSSAAPEFGERSVVDRFAQVEPAVLLAVDGYRYGGRDHDRSEVAARVAERIGARLVRLGYLDGSGWEEGFEADGELAFEPVAFDHPLWVLYSSGTTGLPKPIVHGHGGMLVEQLKHHRLHVDAQAGDRVLWFTTTGWMMWNFLVGMLLTDAEAVLFDGSPGHPDLGRLWDLAEEVQLTTFGTSAAFIESCRKDGVRPRDGRDLTALEAVGSTGSPLSPAGFAWVYEELGPDVWLFSTSGGTDVCTAFVGGVPTLPVHEGELQARALGADVQAWDVDGRPVVGEVGELVLAAPMPSMPVGFWGDEDGSRYHEAYFAHFPGAWRHGDWIEIGAEGGVVVHGRSDATINRGGVRMGTAELYAAVLALDEVLDALVVDVPDAEQGSTLELFVVLRDGVGLDDGLRARIAARVREDCSPRHVPDRVTAVAEVPRTLSGKVLEIPVKRLLMGVAAEEAASRESLANPVALDAFAALAARRSG